MSCIRPYFKRTRFFLAQAGCSLNFSGFKDQLFLKFSERLSLVHCTITLLTMGILNSAQNVCEHTASKRIKLQGLSRVMHDYKTKYLSF